MKNGWGGLEWVNSTPYLLVTGIAMQKDFTRKVPVALENLLNGAFASSGSIRIMISRQIYRVAVDREFTSPFQSKI